MITDYPSDYNAEPQRVPLGVGYTHPSIKGVSMTKTGIYECLLKRKPKVPTNHLLIGLLPVIICFSSACLYLINYNCSQSTRETVTSCHYLDVLSMINTK